MPPTAAGDALRDLERPRDRLGAVQVWRLPKAFSISAVESAGPPRIQIANESDDRVIQIQSNKFFYNWRKKESAYPRFVKVYSEFSNKLDGFRKFLGEAGLNDILPNLRELTYISHVPQGELWSGTEDWWKVFPGLYSPTLPSGNVRFENTTGEWNFEIVPQLGRLHISSNHGRVQDGPEVIVLSLTARGQIDPNDPLEGLGRGLSLGHRTIVQAFAAISSPEALKHWGAS